MKNVTTKISRAGVIKLVGERILELEEKKKYASIGKGRQGSAPMDRKIADNIAFMAQLIDLNRRIMSKLVS